MRTALGELIPNMVCDTCLFDIYSRQRNFLSPRFQGQGKGALERDRNIIPTLGGVVCSSFA